MTRQEFITKLEELMEVESGTITGETLLADIALWDSFAVVGFIAIVDENMGFTPPPRDIAKSKTIEDLISIVSSGIKG